MTIARGPFESEVLALLPKLLGVARRLTRNDADAAFFETGVFR